MSLDEVLRVVHEHVPYVNASTRAEGDAWVGCESLVTDAGALAAVVGGTKAGFGTDDDAVAASLFTEAYAFRVACGALAAYALDLPVPNTAPARVAVRVDKPRPSAVAYLDEAMTPPGRPADIAAVLIAGHMGAFVERVRQVFVVGERLLWGNVAAACAVVFRAVESGAQRREQVRERALRFHDACEPWFAGAGSYRVVNAGTREGWYWDRTNCCLWYRTEAGGYCDNCSLVDPDELARRRRSELGGPAPQ